MKACPCLEIAEICAAPLRIHKLFVALRSRSIIKHVRLTQGGGTIPSGGHCALCNAEWNTLDVSVDKIEGREHHAPSCLLAGTEAS